MNSIQQILNTLIGDYTPVSYTSIDGVEIIPSGFSGVDWGYILSALLFIVGIYSIFRVVGSIISKW